MIIGVCHSCCFVVVLLTLFVLFVIRYRSQHILSCTSCINYISHVPSYNYVLCDYPFLYKYSIAVTVFQLRDLAMVELLLVTQAELC